jgi:hypothetical protein
VPRVPIRCFQALRALLRLLPTTRLEVREGCANGDIALRRRRTGAAALPALRAGQPRALARPVDESVQLLHSRLVLGRPQQAAQLACAVRELHEAVANPRRIEGVRQVTEEILPAVLDFRPGPGLAGAKAGLQLFAPAIPVDHRAWRVALLAHSEARQLSGRLFSCGDSLIAEYRKAASGNPLTSPACTAPFVTVSRESTPHA